MTLIGLVLIAAAAVIGIDIAAQNQVNVDIDVFGRTVATSSSVVFVVGTVVGIVSVFGILLMLDGIARRRRARAEARAISQERERLAMAYEAEHPELRREQPVDASTRERDDVDLRERKPAAEHAPELASEREHVGTLGIF